MALRFLEGFDKVSANTGTASQQDVKDYFLYHFAHLNWSGSQNPQVLDGRVSGQSLSMGNDGFADLNWFDAQLDAAHATVIVGIAIRPPRFGGSQAADFIAFWDTEAGTSSVEHVVIGLEHGCTLYADRGATRLATAVHAMQMDRWHYVEAKITISNTVGVLQVKVNGVDVMNETNIDTNNGAATNQVNLVRFRTTEGLGNGNLQASIDDIYVCDGSGTANNDFLGLTRVENVLPNGVGDSNQFTPSAGSNWENVDDATGDDGDTTYNQSGTTGHLDLFTAQDLTDISSTIHGVKVSAICRVSDTTAHSIIPKVKSSTTEGDGTTRGIISTPAYVGVEHIFEQDPNAAGAWTTTTVNAMQIGYEVG